MAKRACILIVDDEQAIRYFLSEQLSQAGYTVLTAASGEEALARLREDPIDLVLLDLRMGGMGGMDVMKEVEGYTDPPEVIILTAHASFDSAVDAMRLGGFDYLRKPCSTEELFSSVEKGLAKRHEAKQRQQMLRLIAETAHRLQPSAQPAREPAPQQPRFLKEHGLCLDREEETVTRDGQTLALTQTEFRLLCHLMEKPNRLVSYRNLVTTLHGVASGEQEARQALSTHMWRLRRKLGHAPDGGSYIVNIRGRGFRFVGDHDETDSTQTPRP